MRRGGHGATGRSVLPSARLLDVTRLASRAGRVLTGVDRVELAYLRAVLASDIAAFGIARTTLGYVLLDRVGLEAFQHAVRQSDWGKPDLLSQLSNRLSKAQQAAQSLLRRNACARSRPSRLHALLSRHLPHGFAYLNVGHSNLTMRMLATLRALPETRIVVLLHDTIPLDLPQMQRPGTADDFAGKLLRVAALADLVVRTSAASRADVTRHLERLGRVPELVTAHIGIDPAKQDAVSLQPMKQPYFVALGTIEPRKNHRLLLDVWDRFAADDHPQPPRLVICGSRGWLNEDVFARLDMAKACADSRVSEIAGLSDDAIAAPLKGSQGLLFPSLAEGYGLPPLEAAAYGVPVLCGALPSMVELLGDAPIYLDTDDVGAWHRAISDLAANAAKRCSPQIELPNWEAHFRIVFALT